MARRVVVLLFMVLLGACNAPTRNQLVLQAEKPVEGVQPQPNAKVSPHPVCWLPLVDSRPDERNLGQVGRNTYAAEDVNQWIVAALHQITPGAATADAREPEGNLVVLRPRLLRLYIQNVDLTKSAHVVIELEYRRLNRMTFRKIYRGRYTAVNWWNTKNEMTEAFRLALENCVNLIAADIAEPYPSLKEAR